MMLRLTPILAVVMVTFAGAQATSRSLTSFSFAVIQTPATDTSSVCLASPAAPVRSADFVAVGRMHRVDGKLALPDHFAALAMGAIAEHLTVPQPLQLAAYGGQGTVTWEDLLEKKPKTAHLSISMELMISWKKDGSLKRVGLAQSSLDPEFDAAIIRAILAADSSRAFPMQNEGIAGKELNTYVDVDLVTTVPAGAHELFRLRLPVLVLDNPVRPILHKYSPKYPDDLRKRGIEGQVSLKYVVDERGRTIPESYRVVKFSHREFARAVLDELPNTRFDPAKVGGCPVKQMVQQSFNFVLHHGNGPPPLRR